MSSPCEIPSPSRRRVLQTGGALFAWAAIPKFARAADGRDPRLLVIVLRGALDGLSAVAPVGDPDYAGLHGELALSLTGQHPALPLDGFFALNPAMPVFARLFKANQAAVVHAAATGYRERSHFDGQDVLESGLPARAMSRPAGSTGPCPPCRQGERVSAAWRPGGRTIDAPAHARPCARARLGAAGILPAPATISPNGSSTSTAIAIPCSQPL